MRRRPPRRLARHARLFNRAGGRGSLNGPRAQGLRLTQPPSSARNSSFRALDARLRVLKHSKAAGSSRALDAAALALECSSRDLATTSTHWDANKEFCTHRLISTVISRWALERSSLRVRVKVGGAGSVEVEVATKTYKIRIIKNDFIRMQHESTRSADTLTSSPRLSCRP